MKKESGRQTVSSNPWIWTDGSCGTIEIRNRPSRLSPLRLDGRWNQYSWTIIIASNMTWKTTQQHRELSRSGGVKLRKDVLQQVEELARGFSGLQSVIKFMGIYTIVIMAIYVLAIIFFAFAAVAMAWVWSVILYTWPWMNIQLKSLKTRSKITKRNVGGKWASFERPSILLIFNYLRIILDFVTQILLQFVSFYLAIRIKVRDGLNRSASYNECNSEIKRY